MVRIALLFPSPGFFEEAQSIFEEHCQFQKDFENITEQYTLDELVVPSNQFVPSMVEQYDVVISRGITAELFRRRFQQPPLVEIPVVGNDLVRAMLLMRESQGDRLYAIIGSHNMVYGAEELAEILNMRVICYERHTDDDWAGTVDRAIADGCGALLGGVQTCSYAQTQGLPTQIVRTGKEALWQAFTEAKKVVQVQRQEQRKTQRIRTILDYAYEGVLEIDSGGRLVSFNKAAKTMLGLRREHLHLPIEQSLDKSNLTALLISGEDCENQLVRHGSLQLAVNMSQLSDKGSIWGYIATFQDVTELQQMEVTIRAQLHQKGHLAKYRFDDILGGSPELRRTIEQARKYAKVDLDVLITGESGTGKELFAQSIHNASRRCKEPFVAVNCAALNENLLESELFGYVEGAFTGALKRGKKGLFEQAHGGTIFLDEIAEVSTSLQCKLLRVLQEREVMRLGDDKILPLDIRVIAATNKDLVSYVQQGKFREDLYYRLDELRVKIPSLDEHTGDAVVLARHFLAQSAAQLRPGESPLVLSDEAQAYLANRHWAGNIRELRNLCLRLTVACRGPQVSLRELAGVADEDIPFAPPADAAVPIGNGERDCIRDALLRTGYNRTKAAALLGISRSTLWKRIRLYGLDK